VVEQVVIMPILPYWVNRFQ